MFGTVKINKANGGIMSKGKYLLLIVGFILTVGALDLWADVTLPKLLSDGMVLQQGMKVNIWGTADPNEHVTVAFQDQSASTVANGSGHWQVRFNPLSPGGPFSLTITARNTIVLHDVL